MLSLPEEVDVPRDSSPGSGRPRDPCVGPTTRVAGGRLSRRPVRLRPDSRRGRPRGVPRRRRLVNGSVDRWCAGVTSTSSTDRRRPSAESSTPTASRSTTPSGRPPSSSAWRRRRRCQRISTSATGCSSTRTERLPPGRRRPTVPTSPRSRRRRSTEPSSRSSGGTRPTSPRLSGAARWSSRSSCSTTTPSMSRFDTARVADRARPRWSLRPGAYGRGLKRVLPTTSGRSSTDVRGTDIEDNWNAPSERPRSSRESRPRSDALGHAYPLDADEAVTAHLEAVRLGPGPAPSTAGGTREAGR